MKQIQKIRTALLSLLLAASATKANLQEGIDNLLRQSPQPTHIGIMVRDAYSQKVLYETHPNLLFSPASTQKLLTATAALSFLGPNFRFSTDLLSNGKTSGDTLQGDLIVKFTGDPELTKSDLQQLIAKLKEKGITKVYGQLKLDTNTYDNIPYPPGWLWDDLSYSYASPLTTAILDKNRFVIRLTPAAQLGQPPSIAINIPNEVIHFRNSIRTTGANSKDCPLTIYSDAHNDFILHGCLNKRWGSQYRKLALRNPLPYVRSVLAGALRQNGILLQNNIVNSDMSSLNTLATHYSPPLSQLLKHLLKKSDNLITDSLLKQLGAQFYQTQGSWQNGIDALRKVLAPTHIDFHRNLINDGAGLSRYDLITPSQMSQLLAYIYRNPSLHDTLIGSLPIAGVDGTLVERMFSEAKDKRVRAKTGTMTGVSALAGYIYTRHLGVLTFTFFINGYVGKPHPYTHLEDRLCEYLASYRG